MVGVVKSGRHFFCALTLLMLPSSAFATSGHELLRQCEAVVRGAEIRGDKVTLPRGRDAAECWFYMGAIQDLTATVEVEGGPSLLGACLPAETTRMDIIWTFVRYARAHRQELDQRVTAIIIPALMEKFPCERP
jgi:hypothetical protein